MQRDRTPLALARTYLLQSIFCMSKYGTTVAPRLISAFPAWYQCNCRCKTSLDASEPWITTGALKFLRRNLSRSGKIFEWGSGGSTIFYARNSSQVTSVEHDLGWSAKVRERLRECSLSNVEYLLHEPQEYVSAYARDPSSPLDYVSADHAVEGLAFKDYASAIDVNDDEFELISIDGRARPSCVAHAIKHVATGGFLLLDNSDRDYYFRDLPTTLKKWDRLDFPGPYKFSLPFGKTTIWINT